MKKRHRRFERILRVESLEHRRVLAAVPVVSSTVPALNGSPQLPAETDRLDIVFSEPMSNADLASNYELRGAGTDGVMETADDVLYPLTATVTGQTARLAFAKIPAGDYQVTVRDTTIDVDDGFSLDGDADSLAGGDFVRSFEIVSGAATKLDIADFPTNADAGTTYIAMVSALDPYGNVDTNYTGTVRFTSKDVAADLPEDYTFTALDQGKACLPITLNTPGTGVWVKVEDTAGGFSKSQTGITVTGPPISFSADMPAAVEAGVGFKPFVTVLDEFNNRIVDFTGTVRFSSSDPRASLPADYTFTPDDRGDRTFSATLKTAGLQTLTVTDLATSESVSFTVDVAPTTIRYFSVRDFPNPAVSGSQHDVRIRGFDRYQNLTTNYTGTIAFSSNDPAAILPADYTFTLEDQGIAYLPVTLVTPGTGYFIRVADTVVGSSGGQTLIEVQPASGLTVDVSGPTSAEAGVSFSPTVSIFNGSSEPDGGYAGTLSFSSSDPLATLPGNYTFTAADVGTRAFDVTFRTAGTQSLVVTDVASGTSSSISIEVAAAGASDFTLSDFPTSTPSGVEQTLTVAAFDPFGNAATGYVGTVTFSSSDANAVLPGDYTFTPADEGVASFPVTLVTQSSDAFVRVEDSAGGFGQSLTGLTVTNSGPLSISTTVPSESEAGVAVDLPISIFDSGGNLFTSYSGTLSFTSSDANATLPADYTFSAADAGQANLTVTLQKAGIQTLTISDEAASVSTTYTINVTPAALRYFSVRDFPNPAVAGTQHDVRVRPFDRFGNLATNYTGTITFNSNDPAAILPADYTFTTADQGVAFLPVTLMTPGTDRFIRVHDPVRGNSGGQTRISVEAPVGEFPVVDVPANVEAGVPFNPFVAIQNGLGQTITDFAGTVSFDSSDPLATLPSDYTLLATDGGDRTFSATFRTAGPQTLVVTELSTGNSVTASINVSPAAANSLTLTGFPSSTASGTEQQVSVAAFDPYGNAVTDYSGSVRFTSSDAAAILPADYTFQPSDQGVATFPVTLVTPDANAFIRVEDLNAGFSRSQTGIEVTTGATLSLDVVVPATVEAGANFNPFVTVLDAFGSRFSDYVGTVQFSSSDPQATLPADYTFLPTDNGDRTFSARLRTAGLQTITVTDLGTGESSTYSIDVTAANASSLQLDGIPGQVNVGEAQTLTVSVFDSYGNPVTDYLGTVTFSSSDLAALLPADYTFVAGDQGVASFAVTFQTPDENAFVRVTDTLDGFSRSQTGISVLGTADGPLSITTELPSTVEAGNSFSLFVTILNEFNQRFSDYAGTVQFTSSDPRAVLPADYTFVAADSGDRTFPATLQTAGPQTITVTDVETAISATYSIDVTPTQLRYFGVRDFPNPVGSGTQHDVRVRAFDRYGNLVTNYTGTIAFTSNDPAAILPADYTFTTADQGVALLPVTLVTPGTGSFIRVADTTVGSSGGQTGITVQASNSEATLEVTAPSTVQAGSSFDPFVSVIDAFGQLDTDFTGTVTFSSSDPQATLPADYTFSPTDGGDRTFGATLRTAGPQTLTVTDLASSATATVSLDVSPAALSRFDVFGYPSPTIAGQQHDFSVTAVDAFGNTVTDYTGRVAFSSSDTNAILPGDYVFTLADQGTRDFSATLINNGQNRSLVVTDTVGGQTGKQNFIVVQQSSLRYSSGSNIIYVEGGVTATLSDIKLLLPSAPLTLVDAEQAIWELGADIRVEDGSTLLLHGTSEGGDVNLLRMKSEPTEYVEIRADYGQVDILSTQITSWDSTLQAVDTDQSDGRAFIRARSKLATDGVTPLESRMDVRNSEISYLGYGASEAYGLSWKVIGDVGPNFELLDQVEVYGDVIGNQVHHLHFGFYSFGANGMQIRDNEFANNTVYGIDPHDDSDFLVIDNNFVHNNGSHGIICSKRCNNIEITNNISSNNGRHGIMLHREVDDSVVTGNTVEFNGEAGISIYDSNRNTITQNVSRYNYNGIQLNNGSQDNLIENNDFSFNTQFGVYLFKGNDEPRPGSDGRPKQNVIRNNQITNQGSFAIRINEADNNVFEFNTIELNTRGMRLTETVGTVLRENVIPVEIIVDVRGTSTFASEITIDNQSNIDLRLDSFSTAIFL